MRRVCEQTQAGFFNPDFSEIRKEGKNDNRGHRPGEPRQVPRIQGGKNGLKNEWKIRAVALLSRLPRDEEEA